jgi:hypothetical protein
VNGWSELSWRESESLRAAAIGRMPACNCLDAIIRLFSNYIYTFV